MNERELSQRLKTVVDYFPEKARVADIGSDHAYLPCYAIIEKKAVFAIAGEVVEGPYQSACTHVQGLALTKDISVRKGNGLAVINSEDKINTIVIAGMGGPLIRSILEAEPQRLTDNMRLILQPNVAANSIREWAQLNQYQIISETILEEDEKIYEILVLEKSATTVSYNTNEIKFGPFLQNEKSTTFIKFWKSERTTLQTIIKRIEKGSQNEARHAKITTLQQRIQEIDEVLA